MTSTEDRVAAQAAARMADFYSRYPSMRRDPRVTRSAVYDAALRIIRDENIAAVDQGALTAAVDAAAVTV